MTVWVKPKETNNRTDLLQLHAGELHAGKNGEIIFERKYLVE